MCKGKRYDSIPSIELQQQRLPFQGLEELYCEPMNSIHI